MAELFRTPLWLIDTGGWSWETFVDGIGQFFEADPDKWGFWARWYEGMLNGTPLPWDLQEQVALIEDEDWEKGAAHVARLIRDIEAEFLAEKLPQAEAMEFDLETGRFDVTPIPLNELTLVETTLRQVEFALSVALKSNCGLNTSCTAYLYIEHTLKNSRDDPNAIEQNLAGC